MIIIVLVLRNSKILKRIIEAIKKHCKEINCEEIFPYLNRSFNINKKYYWTTTFNYTCTTILTVK